MAQSETIKDTGSSAHSYQPVRAPRGTTLVCKGWQQEAAMRMLMNNLDPDVAERPQDLIIYGGTGKAARNWACYHAIVAALKDLGNDETLLVQSGKPVGVFQTHEAAPRVLIANANLVGHWATWEKFRELERLGLMMYGQMTAGSWIYIGTQGILQGTYETFAAAAQKHFGSDLAGKLVVTGGMGGMGGAQPLAATLNGAAFLGIEVDAERIKRRIRSGYCDICVNSLDEAVRILKNAVRQKHAVSVGLVGNCADVIPELARRGIVPDLLTDQTSAHDPLNGYVPSGLSLEEAAELRRKNPEDYLKRSYDSIARHVTGMLELQKLGAATFDYGNNIRTMAFEHGGVKDAYNFPGFVPAYIRPLVLRRPRAVPLGGAFRRARRHLSHRRPGAGAFPRQRHPESLDSPGAEACEVSGIARAHLLAGLWRTRAVRRAHERSGGKRRTEGAHRHRARPPGLRLRGLTLPRNREHERRQRRHRRLARAERAAQYRLRRQLGFVPPRRRGGDWILAARGASHRGRWHTGDGETAESRADQRPGNRRRSPRGRGL